jgi:hypothetical protein
MQCGWISALWNLRASNRAKNCGITTEGAKVTHSELVERAGRWLRNSAVIPNIRSERPQKVRCGVVLLEPPGEGEQPDAIGWMFRYSSILVECKVSRPDFLRDQKKPTRKMISRLGMGQYRYYLTTPGLLTLEDVAEDWGLLETKGRIVKVRRLAQRQQEYSRDREMSILLTECRKIQAVESGKQLLPTRANQRVTRAIRHTFNDGSGI